MNANGPLHPKVRLVEKKQPKPTHAETLYPETRKKPWRPVSIPRLAGVEASERYIGTSVASAPSPDPWRMRTTMSMATCTLPAVNAPPIMATRDAVKRVHFRPIPSANGPPPRAPTHAPKKKRALTAPMMWLVYAAPGPVVERLKYWKNPG